MTDPIAAAIDSVEADPAWPPMTEIPVLISSTQRPCVLALPTDVTNQEIDEIAAWMLLNARAWIARQSATPRIIVARGVVDK